MIEVQTNCNGLIRYTKFDDYGQAIDFINRLLYVDNDSVDIIYIIDKNDVITYYVKEGYKIE